MIVETAPAKINLYLHVGAVRDDGLHDLASLFVFASDGDEVAAVLDDELSLKIVGPFANGLAPFDVNDNLVLRAAHGLRTAFQINMGAKITLTKNLPIAAGIGGGSADAAAALRTLMTLWDCKPDDETLHNLAFSLGADVPACLEREPVNVSGAGEILNKGPAIGQVWVTLVNPLVDMPTGPVFRCFDAGVAQGTFPASPCQLAPAPIPTPEGIGELVRTTRNDLEAPAISLAPIIGETLAFLRETPSCLGARMSGSGATIFGLYPDAQSAEDAAKAAEENGWWSMASQLCDTR